MTLSDMTDWTSGGPEWEHKLKTAAAVVGMAGYKLVKSYVHQRRMTPAMRTAEAAGIAGAAHQVNRAIKRRRFGLPSALGFSTPVGPPRRVYGPWGSKGKNKRSRYGKRTYSYRYKRPRRWWYKY